MGNKSVLIVYAKRQQQAARRWEMAIAGAPGHKASIISEKIFKQRQFEILSSQPVIFIGMSKPAKELRDVCSIAFNEWGAVCHVGIRRAIVDCDWPDDLEEDHARISALEIAKAIQDYSGSEVGRNLALEIPDLAQTDPQPHGWVGRSKRLASRYSGTDLVEEQWSERSVRRRYVDLLYVYAATRFVAEQLAKFAVE